MKALLLTLLPAFTLSAAEPRPLRVLFLGHESKHHDSGRYCPMLMAALGPEGIYFDYETSPAEALRPERLRYYDAVLLYANHDAIRPEQYQALLGYVRGGGGFVPVHSASYCFRNEDDFIRLVGAQFKSHGGREMSATIVKPDHPAMKGVREFQCWDETYVHHRHGDDREILMVHADGDHREPWTWVRQEGKGRVFYTASGHDERCWSNAGFQSLLKAGILWAVGDRARREYEAFLARRVKPRYEKRPDVANYEKRPEPLPYQFPLEAEASRALTQVPADFRLELFADEEMVGGNPIALTWDERGRCWVAMTRDYPNEIKPAGEGNDEIRILEDTDGDGRADRVTVFADRLNIPTGLLLAQGGLFVAHAPEFLFLRDTDGDGRADVRQSLFTGFWGKGDTHAGPNSLRRGLDNQLYGAVGYSGFKGTVGGVTHQFGQGVYRFAPAGDAIAFLYQFSNNTWGYGQNAVGDDFGSTANGAPSFFGAIPETIGGVREKVNSARSISRSDRLHPITPNIRQVDVFGGYTSAAGHVFIGGPGLPPRLQDVALVCEPTARLVGIMRVKRDGAGYVAEDGFNLVASADEWFAPVHAEVGPDGAVWIADWYDFIIQHNPTPSVERGGYAARNGAGNAHVNPLRENRLGRIWRAVWKEAPAPDLRSLAGASPEALVAALGHGNPFWRATAQRLLVEGQAPLPTDKLRAQLRDEKQPIAAAHALWTLRGRGALESADLQAGLLSRAPEIRRNAIRTVGASEAERKMLFDSTVLSDPDPLTRLAAFIKLAEFPASPALKTVVSRLAAQPENQREELLKTALGMLQRRFGVEAMESALKPVGPNLITNASFEDGQQQPEAWRRSHYSGQAKAVWDDQVARTGQRSLRLDAGASGADTAWFTQVKLKPRTTYELRAWIRTRGVSGAEGALLNVHQLQRRQELMPGVRGNAEWTERVLVFQSEDLDAAEINCLLGGWGLSRGTAWFDDLSLRELQPEARPGGDAPPAVLAGDPARGRAIFFEHPVAACMHCHAVGGQGSAFGPALDGIAARKDMAYITQSLLEPNAVIAEGTNLPVSPMPPLGLLLNPQEIEDVKAFLGTLK
jgi:putative membrane-bound dehydrogenase-like protein